MADTVQQVTAATSSGEVKGVVGSPNPPEKTGQETTNATAQNEEVDLYDVLGLKHTASHTEVQLAFKKKASECYPAKNPEGDRSKLQRKFNEVTYAYSILHDPARRDDYDQIHHYDFSKEQALQQFEDFFKQYGILQEEQEFFRRYYPARRRTYYDVLDLPKNASQKLIEESFRRKAIALHPSNFNGDRHKEQAFRELCQAYHNLSDRERRKVYNKVEFQRVPTFQAHAQFNNYFQNQKEYENETDRKLLGEFVRKTSQKEEKSWERTSQNPESQQNNFLAEEVTRHTVESSGPEGPQRTTITRKTSTVNGRTKNVSIEEQSNADGTINVTETIKDGNTGSQTTNRYVLPKDGRPLLLDK